MKKELEAVKSNIASKLRGLRAEKGISREKLAEITGLDNATICRYENATTTQSLDKLIILADFYKVNLAYFFNLNYENMYRKDNSIQEKEGE